MYEVNIMKMKALLSAMLVGAMSFCLPAFADQQTTVLTQKVNLNRLEADVPFIDGSNDVALEKMANTLLREEAQKLANRAGGNVSYEVKLNRPSVVSVLLQAKKGDKVTYKGLNIDLTTGKEFTVTDFFVDNDATRAALGNYENVLFGDEGLYVCSENGGAYDKYVPYASLLKSIRIGEAGRLLQIARLTASASDKVLEIDAGSLIALKLDSNPSTGYGWEVKPDQKAITKVGSSFTILNNDPTRMGAPGLEILMLAAQQKGTYKVTMQYKRPWEQLTINEFSFTVIVD